MRMKMNVYGSDVEVEMSVDEFKAMVKDGKTPETEVVQDKSATSKVDYIKPKSKPSASKQAKRLVVKKGKPKLVKVSRVRKNAGWYRVLHMSLRDFMLKCHDEGLGQYQSYDKVYAAYKAVGEKLPKKYKTKLYASWKNRDYGPKKTKDALVKPVPQNTGDKWGRLIGMTLFDYLSDGIDNNVSDAVMIATLTNRLKLARYSNFMIEHSVDTEIKPTIKDIREKVKLALLQNPGDD